MTNDNYVTIRCLEITQPIGAFYIACIDRSDLVYISYADRLRIESDMRDVEQYLGVERPISAERVDNIKKYVKTVDAAFPTSIIITVSSEHIQYDVRTGIMKVKRDQNIAKIIDGQHRIAGLDKYDGPRFELNVTIFIDMDLEDQAMVFATINLEQTKVRKSIVYALYEYTKSRSPQKTCHNIAKLLNGKENSPFNNKIKILGTATEGITGETLTQATFVERLLPLITKDPLLDRDLIKRGKKLVRAKGNENTRLIFRNMFIDEHDGEIARVLYNYFSTIQQKWPQAWNEVRSGHILNRTTGFSALMRFLPSVYCSLGGPGIVVNIDNFASVFESVTLDDYDFTSEKYKPGTSGETALFNELRTMANLSTLQKPLDI